MTEIKLADKHGKITSVRTFVELLQFVFENQTGVFTHQQNIFEIKILYKSKKKPE